MIALTHRAKYALKAVLFLARQGSVVGHGRAPVPSHVVAKNESIPLKFLEGIMRDLAVHGYVVPRKGRGGGYLLAKEPNTLRVGPILRIFEGPLAPIPCVSKRHYAPCDDCHAVDDCAVRRTMLDVKRAILKVLDTTSIDDLRKRDGQPIDLSQ